MSRNIFAIVYTIVGFISIGILIYLILNAPCNENVCFIFKALGCLAAIAVVLMPLTLISKK